MSAPGGRRSPSLAGDEAELFKAFNSHLVRILQRRTSTSRETVDDAAAFAWQQFLQHQPDRERNWRAWLVKTAEREVWRLSGAEASHAPLSIDDLERVAPGIARPFGSACAKHSRRSLVFRSVVATSRHCRSPGFATRRSPRCAG